VCRKGGVSQAKPTHPHQRRGLGLDTPCSMCGEEIYYNYKGPFEGVCGRCTDRVIAKRTRAKTSRTVVVERIRARRGRLLVVLLAFLLGALVATALSPYLPF